MMFPCREFDDDLPDFETIHSIKTIHLPRNSGDAYNTTGQKTDFAIIELVNSVNSCEENNRECWPISPVSLVDPFVFIEVNQIVKTLGKRILGCPTISQVWDIQNYFY